MKLNVEDATIVDISDDEDSKNILKTQENPLESQGQIVENPGPNLGDVGVTTDGVNDDYNLQPLIIQTDSAKMIEEIAQYQNINECRSSELRSTVPI